MTQDAERWTPRGRSWERINVAPSAEFGLRVDIAQLVCEYVHDLDETHWGPSIPYPCSPCVALAERIIEASPTDRFGTP